MKDDSFNVFAALTVLSFVAVMGREVALKAIAGSETWKTVGGLAIGVGILLFAFLSGLLLTVFFHKR